jgi:hypothetical protein
MTLLERVNEADRQARIQIKEVDDDKKDHRQRRQRKEKRENDAKEIKTPNKKRKHEYDDSEKGFGVKKNFKKKKTNK